MMRRPFLGGLWVLLLLLFLFAFAFAAVMAAVALLIVILILIVRRRRRVAPQKAAEPLAPPYFTPARTRNPAVTASATARGSGDARLNRLVLSLLEKERSPYRRARGQDYEDL